jgi:hypothetical protein
VAVDGFPVDTPSWWPRTAEPATARMTRAISAGWKR